MYGRLKGIPAGLIRGLSQTGARAVYTKQQRKRCALRAESRSGAHDHDEAGDDQQRADHASGADRLAEHERARQEDHEERDAGERERVREIEPAGDVVRAMAQSAAQVLARLQAQGV